VTLDTGRASRSRSTARATPRGGGAAGGAEHPTLTTGLKLTVPQTLNYNVATTSGANSAALSTTITTTVQPYYTVTNTDTWTSITQSVYGTSNANAVAALQVALSNPTLSTGLKLTVPPTSLQRRHHQRRQLRGALDDDHHDGAAVLHGELDRHLDDDHAERLRHEQCQRGGGAAGGAHQPHAEHRAQAQRPRYAELRERKHHGQRERRGALTTQTTNTNYNLNSAP